MHKLRLLPFIAVALLLGAGCANPFQKNVPAENATTTKKIRKIDLDKPSAYQPLCLKFTKDDGFKNWLDGYEKGEENAVLLTAGVKLPKEADKKLLADIRGSFKAQDVPRYFCVLDPDNNVFAWYSDVSSTGTSACRGVMATRVNDKVTMADITTQGEGATCTELCAPKYQNDKNLVWQCDVRETGQDAKWNEIYMERATGNATAGGCVMDGNGTTPGCVR